MTIGAAVASCSVWWSEPVGDIGALLSLLDDAEQERCRCLRSPHDRARFVTGRLLARSALAAELGVAPAAIALLTRCRACGGPHGKPVLAGKAAHAAIDFSISHAAERVVVATSRDGAIGVDVERIRPVGDLAGPDAGVLADDERCVLGALAPDEREAAFTRYWTRKEAVLKATGEGLTTPPASLWVTAPGEPPAVAAWPAGRPPREVRMLDLDAGRGYRACVAVLTARPLQLTEARVQPPALRASVPPS